MNRRKSDPSDTDPASWLERAAQAHPHRTVLLTPAGRRLSYEDLWRQSARFANALAALGVRPGDRLVARTEKSVEAVLLYGASLRLGAVLVPINVASSMSEVDYLLSDCNPRVAVLRPEDMETLAPIAKRASVEHLYTLGSDGSGTLAEAAAASSADSVPCSHEADAAAAIVYTSGTTGRPKGAVLTRGNLASNAVVLAEAWRFTRDDVVLHTLPLFHVHGLFVAINIPFATGSAILLLPKFEVAAVLQWLPKVTVLMGVPTHYTRLLHEPALGREVAAHMRLFVCGSAPLLPETHQEFLKRTGHTILERYGMTETLMNTSNPYDGPRIPGSVGLPLRGISLRVADKDTGAVTPAADAIGQLEIRGPNVFSGYWRDPGKTRAEFTSDGWFRTGDLGRIDGSGYVHIVGRLKDVVISGGYNVYPKEIEIQLDRLPGVAESAVFGVPHPDLGEAVTAVVVPQTDATLEEADIIAAVRSMVARYKIPRRVLVLAELPRNAMGKVEKNKLRAMYASLYVSAASASAHS